ncbi:hypothetical protein RRU01S_01_00370 [Agrobacterium rubi TR3 = NBRC 13261]|uniref:Uncharacterized protein n=1 Tax=Agrobacterium rubi TR3 = NBRC 13261 TaxID=1368415 RepID=A0A081CPL4_9HYPH|nr:hypothetical protein [Agrobacterium rubi]MBP1877590.1 hypothetical protein [Agrobacterium rubi]GAK68610.1 hypothetical protein RRU01S_01_00370 [Agrobacterium rubi TR3 = NBRC 13261]
MKRLWPEEFNSILRDAQEVTLDVPAVDPAGHPHGESTKRQALKVRMTQADYERIWPLAEARYRVQGPLFGKAITLITNNPHYQKWHPEDGGYEEDMSDSGKPFQTKYVIVHFLLDDVMEKAEA